MLRTMEVAGVRYRVADEGVGPVLLFVHGFPLNHSMWSAQITEFSRTHRVLAPDLRGFGETDGALYSVSMAQFADDLALLLEALHAEKPITFCGLSMGGYIGWQFALRHPEWLGRLIACDTRAAADSAEAASNRLRLAELALESGAEPVARAMLPKLFAPGVLEQQPILTGRVREMMLNTSPIAIAAAHRGMAIRQDVTSILPSFGFPTLVIAGEHDAISPPAEMNSIAEAMPNAEFVLIPAAGHMAPLENPVAFNAALNRFLAASIR